VDTESADMGAQLYVYKHIEESDGVEKWTMSTARKNNSKCRNILLTNTSLCEKFYPFLYKYISILYSSTVKFNISQSCKFATIYNCATSFPVPIVYITFRMEYIVDENRH
jgi:hypothetical protein